MTQQEAFEKEKYLIKKYKTNINRYGNDYGYNLTDGGEGTLGHKVPESLKEKSRLRLLNKTGSECCNSRVVVCDGIEYCSLQEFSKANNFPKGDISGWLLGKVGMPKYWYDKKLHYKDLGFEIVKLSEVSENRYRKTMVEDKIFNTLKECGEYLGINASNVCLYLNNKKRPPDWIIEKNLRYENENYHVFKTKNKKQ